MLLNQSLKAQRKQLTNEAIIDSMNRPYSTLLCHFLLPLRTTEFSEKRLPGSCLYTRVELNRALIDSQLS